MSSGIAESHLEKMFDQVCDATFDSCLTSDSKCEVACEAGVKDNVVMVAGEITGAGRIDFDPRARFVS